MDAAPNPRLRERELGGLRARAYGPDADIEGDAEALARLIELEELARADAASSAHSAKRISVHLAGDPGRADARGDAEDSGAGSASTASDVSGVTAPADPNGSSAEGHGAVDIAAAHEDTSRRWWRGVPTWAVVSGAAAIGLLFGLVAPALTPPHPTATLQIQPLGSTTLDFDAYGIHAASAVRFESFHDLEVWSADTDTGTTCIVVTNAASEWMAAGCAPGPLDATADISFFAGMRPIDGLDLPPGSVVRFIERGDVMEVWIAPNDEQS